MNTENCTIFQVMRSVFSAATEINRNSALNTYSTIYSLNKPAPKYFKLNFAIPFARQL